MKKIIGLQKAMKTCRRSKEHRQVNRNEQLTFRHTGVCPPEIVFKAVLVRNRNRKLQTSKAPLKSQAQGTSSYSRALRQIRGVFQ